MDDNEEIRYRTELVPLTQWQRSKIWWNGVVDAIRSKPDTHWTKWIHVEKGEAGYESAPYSFSTDPSPLRYTVSDGEWIKIDPPREETPPNLKWFNGQP